MAGAAAVMAHSRAGGRTGRDGRGEGDHDDPAPAPGVAARTADHSDAHAAPSECVVGCDDEDDGPPMVARRGDRCQNL